jgi:hypothetical protein
MTNKLDKFLSKRGQICSLSISKPLKLRKGVDGILSKQEKITNVQAGVNYANMREVKEAGIVPKKLPYGEWKIFPHVIEHNGQNYYRFSSLTNTKKRVKYLYNGEEISEEKAQELALASEFKKESPIVFNVKEENLEEIN